MARTVKDEKGRPVKVDGQGVPKKNRHALRCCLTFVIVWVVILGIGVGGALFVGDMLVKNATDDELGIFDCIGAYSRFKNYRKVEKNELNNSFEGTDGGEFIDSIADAFLLQNIETQEVVDMIESFVDDAFKDGSSAESGANSSALLSEGEESGEGDTETDTKKSSDAMEKFKDLMLKEGNLNKAKLSTYDDSIVEEFYVKINDKSVAAFVNDLIINSVLDNENFRSTIIDSVNEGFSGLEIGGKKADVNFDDFDFKDILQIKQITFYTTGTGESKQAGVKVITQTNIKKMINSTVDKFNGDALLREEADKYAKKGIDVTGGFFKFVLNTLLPKKLYFTADIPASGGGGTPRLSLNSTTTKDFDKMTKLLPSINDAIDGIFGEKGTVTKMVDTANDVLPLKSAIVMDNNGSGTLTCDLISVALTALGVNKDGEEPITSKEVYLAMRTLVCANVDAAMLEKEEFDYTNYRLVRDGDGIVYGQDGMPEFESIDPSADVRELTDIQIEYEDALLSALTEYYGLKEKDSQNQPITFDTVFNMMSGDGEASEFDELFDPAKLRLITNSNEEAKRVPLTPQMLAALIAKRMEKFLGDSEEVKGDSITPRYVKLTESEYNGTLHNFMEVGVEFKLKSMLKNYVSDKGTAELVEGLLAGNLLFVAKIDITYQGAASAPAITSDGEGFYAPTEIALDILGFEDTGRIMRLFDAFGFGNAAKDGAEGESNTGFKGVLTDILLPVRDIIHNMCKALPGLEIGESEMIMPNVFAAIAGILNAEGENNGGEEITADDLRDNLKFLMKDVDFGTFTVNAATLNGLMQEFDSKYATTLVATNDGLNPIFGAFGINEGGTELSGILDKNALKNILKGNPATDLRAEITGERFASLLYEYMESNQNSDMGKYVSPGSIYFVEFHTSGGRDYLELSVKIPTTTLLDYSSGSGSFSSFLSGLVDEIYVTVKIDITVGASEHEPTTTVINGKTPEDKQKTEKLFEMLEKLTPGFENDFTSGIANELDGTVRGIFADMAGAGAGARVDETTRNLMLSDLFSVTAASYNKDKNGVGELSAANIRAVLTKLYIDTYAGNDREWFNFNNVTDGIVASDLIAGKTIDFNKIDITDRELAGILLDDDNFAPGEGFPTGLLALNILAESDSSANASNYRDWLNGYNGAFDSNADYMTIVMRVEREKLGDLGDSTAFDLVPEDIYMTFVFKRDGSEFIYQFYRINNMTALEQADMFKFTGTNPNDFVSAGGTSGGVDGATIGTKISAVFGIIDDLIKAKVPAAVSTDYTYGGNTPGLGKMVITLNF